MASNHEMGNLSVAGVTGLSLTPDLWVDTYLSDLTVNHWTKTEIAQELLQNNGQPSLLLNFDSLHKYRKLAAATTVCIQCRKACFRSIIPAISAALLKTAPPTFLPNAFPRTGVTSFNTSVSQEEAKSSNRLWKLLAFPVHLRVPMYTHVPTGCVSDAAQVNTTVMPNPPVPTLLQTVCHPSPLLTDRMGHQTPKLPPLRNAAVYLFFNKRLTAKDC